MLHKAKILSIAVFLAFVGTEAGILVLYPALFDGKFSREELQQQIRKNDRELSDEKVGTIPDHRDPDYIRNKVLHPYLGFVYRPDDPPELWKDFYGFYGVTTLQKMQPDKVVVAVSGGSFAQGLINDSKNELVAGLKAIPRFRGKEIEIVGLAIGGYKQPQQLMSISYLLSLGAEFDFLINIDGFNEITLPIVENYFNGVALSYPRFWTLYAKKSHNRETLDLLSDINILQRSRTGYREFFSTFSWSNLGLLVWKSLDLSLEREVYALNALLAKRLTKDSDYQVSGPYKSYASDLVALQRAAGIWMRSSLQLQALCAANGIKYLHVLQPNQYVPGSKPMGREERMIAFEDGPFIYKDIVVKGYPLLREGGQTLRAAGVAFQDLTLLFKDENQPLYADKLCHINKAGNDLVVSKLLEVIEQQAGTLSGTARQAGL